jgi:hypothetical protein
VSRPRFVRVLAAGIAAAALVLGTPASAQAPGQGLGGGIDVDFTALSTAKVGAWADYTMTVPGQPPGDTPKVRYAVVEKANGKLALEIVTPTPQGELDLRLEFAQKPDSLKMSGGRMKMGAQTMEFPAGEVSAAPPIKKGDTPGDLVGTEDVTTPAGTFPCKHYKKTMQVPGNGPGQPPGKLAMELWMNEKVSPTGLVKSSMGPMSMMLAATGTGATSKTK